MGSVPDLYITGDNDPEIEPVSYYRHYLYCDACGSFEIESWTEGGKNAGLEKTRSGLGTLALISAGVSLVAGWSALVPYPPLWFLLVLVVGIPMAVTFRRLVGPDRREVFKTLWAAAKWAFPALLLVALVDGLAGVVAPWVLILAGLIGAAVALGLQQALTPEIKWKGMRCRSCGATYANGTAFFTDLEANPRGLAVSDVPRPLGRSEFLVGKSVD